MGFTIGGTYKKMKQLFPLFFTICLSVVISSGLHAQDKVRTVNGDIYTVKVLQVTKDIVRIDPIQTDYTVIKQFPRNYVESITFSDGAEVKFAPGGELIRDGLADVPTIKAKTDGIYAERLFKLNEEETMYVLGQDKYYLMYKPAKTKTIVGMAQMVAGGVSMFPLFRIDNKGIRYRTQKGGFQIVGTYIQSAEPLRNSANTLLFSGLFNPYIVSGEILSTTTMVCGLVNFFSSWVSLSSALKDTPLPTISNTKTHYWTGIGMMAAGAGALVAGTIDMANKSEWYWDLWDGTGSTDRYNIKNGTYPVAGPILALAGSILMNIGITEFTVASTRLKGYQKTGSTAPLALACGPTPTGYGMTLTF